MESSVDLEEWSASLVSDLDDDWLSVFIMAWIEPHPPTASREEIASMRIISRVN